MRNIKKIAFFYISIGAIMILIVAYLILFYKKPDENVNQVENSGISIQDLIKGTSKKITKNTKPQKIEDNKTIAPGEDDAKDTKSITALPQIFQISEFPSTNFFQYNKEIIYNNKSNGAFYSSEVDIKNASIKTQKITRETNPNIEILEQVAPYKFIARYVSDVKYAKTKTDLIILEPINNEIYCTNKVEIDNDLKIGSQSRNIENLQRILSETELSRWIKDYTPSLFDGKTLDTLKRFQRLNNIKDSGVLDKETVQKLNDECIKKGEEKAKKAGDHIRLKTTQEELGSNLIDISTNNKEKIFILSAKKPTSSAIGEIFNIQNNKKTLVMDNPFHEWASSWMNEKNILLSTKPSYLSIGLVYILNLDEKTMTQVLPPMKALEAQPISEDLILFSGYYNGEYKTFIKSLQTGITSQLNISTHPLKCSKIYEEEYIYCGIPSTIGNNMPDKWYKGLKSFSDYIVKYNIRTGSIKRITNITNLDVEKIELSNDKLFLIIKDKNTGKLWGVQTQQAP